jgi:hypothetical protein
MSSIEIVLTFDDSKGINVGLMQFNKQVLEVFEGIRDFKEQSLQMLPENSNQLSIQEVLKTIHEPLTLNIFLKWFSALNYIMFSENEDTIIELDSFLKEKVELLRKIKKE